MRPVGSELKFHGNAGHHAKHEVNTKDARPESGGLVVFLVVPPQPQCLQHHNQGRETHGELGEKVVKRDRESEVQTVNQECAVHEESLWTRA